MHKLSSIAAALLSSYAAASPIDGLVERQSCPNIHVFGARETTAPAGFGTAGVVVDLILAGYPGSTSEAIVYPACGGQSSCGSVSYASSEVQGVAAVAAAVNAYNKQCPSTQLILVGYSQGGQIIDDAFCGGGDTDEGLTSTAIPIDATALGQIKAVIEMGNPRYIYGLSYEVGTCTAQGFAARPAGFVCPSAGKIQSYCDATDPYCCNGSDAATHQGYGTEYGQAALKFVESKLSAVIASTGGSSTTAVATSPATSAASLPTSSSGTVAQYGQCGGIGYTGATACVSPYTCHVLNSYYSQCS